MASEQPQLTETATVAHNIQGSQTNQSNSIESPDVVQEYDGQIQHKTARQPEDHSAALVSKGHFSRPHLETPEDLGASFQFQRAAPARVAAKANPTRGNLQEAIQHGVSSYRATIPSWKQPSQHVTEKDRNVSGTNSPSPLWHPQLADQHVVAEHTLETQSQPAEHVYQSSKTAGKPHPDSEVDRNEGYRPGILSQRRPSNTVSQHRDALDSRDLDHKCVTSLLKNFGKHIHSSGRTEVPKALALDPLNLPKATLETCLKSRLQNSHRRSAPLQAIPDVGNKSFTTESLRRSFQKKSSPKAANVESRSHLQVPSVNSETRVDEPLRSNNRLQEAPRHQNRSSRPLSATSNVSKRRLERDCSIPSPAMHQKMLEAFSQSWNELHSCEQSLFKSHKQKLREMEERLMEKDFIIDQLQKQLDSQLENQNEDTRALQERNEELEHRDDSNQKKLQEKCVRLAKVEEKSRVLRIRLNDAIKEQQRLLLDSRESCARAIKEVTTEKKCRESTEERLRESESTQKEIRASLLSGIKDAREHIGKLHHEREKIMTELAAKQDEVQRERARVEALEGELKESRQLNKETLQSLVSDNKTILGSAGQKYRQFEVTIEEQIESLKNLLSQRNELSACETCSNLSQSLSEIRSVGDNTMKHVTLVIQQATEAAGRAYFQTQADANDKLETIHTTCQSLTKQLEDNTDVQNLHKRLNDTAMVTESQSHMIWQLQDMLQQKISAVAEQWEENQVLSVKVASLQDVLDEQQSSAEELHNLASQVERLQLDISECNNALAERDDELASVHAELDGQIRKLKVTNAELRTQTQAYTDLLHKTSQKSSQSIQNAVTTATANLSQDIARSQDELGKKVAENCQLRIELQEAQDFAQKCQTSDESRADNFKMLQHQLEEQTKRIKDLEAELSNSVAERLILGSSLQEREKLQPADRKVDSSSISTASSLQVTSTSQSRRKLHGDAADSKVYCVNQQEQFIGRGPGSSRDIGNHEIGTDAPQNGDGPSFADNISHDPRKKVVIVSPAAHEDFHECQTIEEERQARRSSEAPPSIMKRRVTRSMAKESEEGPGIAKEFQNLPTSSPSAPTPSVRKKSGKRKATKPVYNPQPSNSSSYNRLVTGATPRSDGSFAIKPAAAINPRKLFVSPSGRNRKSTDVDIISSSQDVVDDPYEIADEERPKKCPRLDIQRRTETQHVSDASQPNSVPESVIPDSQVTRYLEADLSSFRMRTEPPPRSEPGHLTYGRQGPV